VVSVFGLNGFESSVNTTFESQSPEEQELQKKRPLPNLLVEGFRLVLRNWPFVLWAYGINLVYGLLAAIPFATGLKPFLDHSLAAQPVAGTIDISYLFELMRHLHQTTFFETATNTAGWLTGLQFVFLFLLFAGTIFVYVSAEPPQLSVLMRGGVAYFWRFVRGGLMAGGISVVILAILFAARSALLSRLGEVYVDRQMFYYSASTGALVLFVGILLRLWFDLVEVYIVHNVMDGENRVREALLPAYRLLFSYFFRTVGCFLLAGIAGVAALALCLYVWKTLVPANQVWLACMLSQVGLFLLLTSRFWQRGIGVALVMSADPPILATTDEIAAMVEEEEELPSLAGVAGLAGLSEPTLRDLVAKLRTEPWATPDKTPKPDAPQPTVIPPDPVSDPKALSKGVSVPEATLPNGPKTVSANTPTIIPPGTSPGIPKTIVVPKVDPMGSPTPTPTPTPALAPEPSVPGSLSGAAPGPKPGSIPGSGPGSIYDRHATKFPLGGPSPNPARDPLSSKDPPNDPEKDPWRGKL
jgi:hypothetical protein